MQAELLCIADLCLSNVFSEPPAESGKQINASNAIKQV